MSKHYPQSESMKALEQSLNDHMEICSLRGKVKRLKAKNARLKADVETLKEAWVDKKMQEDRDALLLEVERLRKAGDAMASALILFEMKSEEEREGRIKAWSAAKEGKQP